MRNTFDHIRFVKSILDSAPEIAHSPAGMERSAIIAGTYLRGEALRKRLRDSCENLANTNHYKRLRNKEVKGYQYQSKKDALAQKVAVLVPKASNFMGIVGGSGVVSIKIDGVNHVYYEGNLYGAENMQDMQGRIQIAASRALTKAPTTALLLLMDDMLENNFDVVGEYQYKGNTLTIDTKHENCWKEWRDQYGNNNDQWLT